MRRLKSGTVCWVEFGELLQAKSPASQELVLIDCCLLAVLAQNKSTQTESEHIIAGSARLITS